MVANLRNVDEDLAKRVAAGLGVDLPKAAKPARAKVDLPPSPALSIQRNAKRVLKGRKIGVLIADGSDAKALAALKRAAEKEGATLFVVAPRLHGLKLSDGSAAQADGQLLGSPSAMFDAVAICLDDKHAKTLAHEGAAVKWVMDAYAHLKAIGASETAKPLLDRAGVEKDAGVCDLGPAFLEAATTRQWAREPKLRMLA